MYVHTLEHTQVRIGNATVCGRGRNESCLASAVSFRDSFTLVADIPPQPQDYVLQRLAPPGPDVSGRLRSGAGVALGTLQELEAVTQAIGARGAGARSEQMQDIARHYIGLNGNGKLNDIDLRQRLANHLMDRQAHSLTLARVAAETLWSCSPKSAAF